jgi:hypothetical protein
MHLDEAIFNSEFNERATKDRHVQSVINKFAERSEIGLIKYGTTLERDDYSLLNWLEEAQQEAMDFVLYLEVAKSKIKDYGIDI